MRELQAAQPDTQWFLIIGQDQYTGLHTWRDWRELVGLVTLVVAKRPGLHAYPHPDLIRIDQRNLTLPMMDVSSTEIRTRIGNGASIDDLVPAAVARYIDQHHLYRPDPSGQPRS